MFVCCVSLKVVATLKTCTPSKLLSRSYRPRGSLTKKAISTLFAERTSPNVVCCLSMPARK